MSSSNQITTETINRAINLYLSRWKFILFCVIVALGLAFLKIRYSDNLYLATATIKLKKNDKSNNLPKLSELKNYGLFSKNFSNTLDEIETIKSRRLISKVVEELNLNIQYFISGRVKSYEVYFNPPVNINFFESDSVIQKVNTSFFVSIISENEFLLSKTDNQKILSLEKSEAQTYEFGDRIETDFGDIVITPNFEESDYGIGTSLQITLLDLSYVTESYLNRIKIGTKEDSNVLKLQIEDRIPRKGELILNTLVNKYNEDVINDKEAIVKATSDFINNRLDLVSSELEQVDLTAENLKKNNRLTALTSQSNIFLQSEKENEEKIITTSNQLSLVEYMSDHLNSNNTDSDFIPPNVGITDNSVAQITKRHNELVMERNRLLKNSSEKNPTVKNLNNEIRGLKENLSQSLENIKTANQITLNSLNKEDQRLSSQIYSAPTKERKFRDINRQQSIKESLYLYLLEKREETAITLGMSSPNAKIIDLAYAGSNPVSPKKKIIFLSALLLGLALPIAIIYILDIIDNKIYTKEQLLDTLNLPYLGDIPRTAKKTRLIKQIDYSPKAEAFRIIRSNIDFMLKEVKGCKTIFVTSTTSQEGKSHTSINLASSFSFSGKKTLIIETDIRVPRVNDYLKIKSKNDNGLTDYISDETLKIEDIMVPVKDNENLTIIPSGTLPPNPAELLMSQRAQQIFKEAKKHFDYIITDTAAVGLVTDTLLISHNADMVVYVVSANNVDKNQIKIAKTLDDQKRLPKLSLLLNGTVKKKGYGYGYGGKAKKKKWYQFR